MERDPLIDGLVRRDQSALAVLYDRYGAAVYSFVVRMTRDPGTAEEIVLDAFLHVWNEAPRLATPQASVQSWLFTVARSRTIDRLRARAAAKRRQPAVEQEEAGGDRPDEISEIADRRRLVRAAMAELSDAQRAALELAYYEGLSHSEIAQRLGEPLGTVKTRIRQAMLVLRRHLAPTLGEGT